MMRGLLVILSFVSTILFPWPLTVALALTTAYVAPLAPLAIGLFADTLYYVPPTPPLPLFTFCGLAVTVLAFFVRGRVRTGMMGE